ncbi:TPA: hypothetical protein H1009_03655 [archaeon]|nr:hypothetical protein [Candidatus Naiadarchaeales archaeon SRR2090153.bin461]
MNEVQCRRTLFGVNPLPRIQIKMIDKKVREKLVEVAKKLYKTPDGRRGIIYYADLVVECKLDLDLHNIGDRNRLSDILGEISKHELDSTPPMPPISVLVVLKDIRPIMPAYGFFNYMDELRVRKPKETDEQMRNRLMNWCYDYWSKQ